MTIPREKTIVKLVECENSGSYIMNSHRIRQGKDGAFAKVVCCGHSQPGTNTYMICNSRSIPIKYCQHSIRQHFKI